VPADNFEVLSIFSIVLPTGVTIERTTFDGTIYDGVTVARGRIEMDVTPTGWPAIIAIGDLCVDDVLEEDLKNIPAFLDDLHSRFDDDEVSAQDWADLHALLSLDLVQLGAFAALPPAVESAIAAWFELPPAEMRQIAQMVGFGAWYAARSQVLAA
jgi:hypothetical protein